MNKKIDFKILIGLLVLLILAIVAIISTKKPYNDKEVLTQEERTELKTEFNKAYKKDIEKSGNIIEYSLEAKEERIEIFEGNVITAYAYNSQIPGPTLKVKLGDTVKIKLKNSLPESTTIHWHGVRVPFEMDGVPNVGQKPIQPGEQFVYEFTPKDAGTYWYHPHVRGSEQVEKGLYGAIIVEDPISKEYSKDITWIVDDWKLEKDGEIDPDFVTPVELMHDGRWGNVITVNGNLNNSVDVNPGERIRLRLINSSNGRHYAPKIENADAFVIAIDGMYVKNPWKYEVEYLAPGNRIDLDITIPSNQNAIKITDTFTEEDIILGTLNIVGNTVDTPNFPLPSNPLVPSWDIAKEATPDQEFILNSSGHMMNINWEINYEKYPNITKEIFKEDEFIKVTFVNTSPRLHPMHLHGQFFKVLDRRNSPISPTRSDDYFRDTVIVWPNEVVDIGLIPYDVGTWALHCHIQEHADSGMMTLVEVQ